MRIRSALNLVCLLLGTHATLLPQSSTGTFTGLVSDATGAVIAGAKITARNINTGEAVETVSSGTGNYVIVGLRVGSYELSANVAGFKSWVRGPIALSSNDNVRIDMNLEVGSTTEQVKVTAEAPPLKTESTEVSTVMENK